MASSTEKVLMISYMLRDRLVVGRVLRRADPLWPVPTMSFIEKIERELGESHGGAVATVLAITEVIDK